MSSSQIRSSPAVPGTALRFTAKSRTEAISAAESSAAVVEAARKVEDVESRAEALGCYLMGAALHRSSGHPVTP